MLNNKKVTDELFSARWGLKQGNHEYAYAKITSALEQLGALKPLPEDTVDRPDLTHVPEVYEPPRFEKVPGVRFKEIGRYRTDSGMFAGLVVHYTVSGRTRKAAIGVLQYLAKNGLGCMVMDENGIIYVPEDFDVLRDAAYHAGKSSWGKYNSVSSVFAGMEVCCMGRRPNGPSVKSTDMHWEKTGNIAEGWYELFTPEQVKALDNFVAWASDHNPEFKIANLVGHDEVSPGRKTDPGGSLGMTMADYRMSHKA